MADVRPPLSFVQLVQDSQRIVIPLIQRDYAQGREAQRDLRNDFLTALLGALKVPAEDANAPLVLDFVYGSTESEGSRCFVPLDGQQRLTTLFLLHWYVAWHDGQLLDFRNLLWDGEHSLFTYRVRPSSTEFFDELMKFDPTEAPGDIHSIRQHLEDQPWFFLRWRLDPTIQSVLTMLDAIHDKFRGNQGLFSRLVDPAHPAITFHLLPLEHFGLSDDLYIKMNARGKPLTAFETFKARFEDLLRELFPSGTRPIGNEEFSIPDFFERRMDTQWTDFFWNHQHDTFDEAALNLVWALIRISLDPSSASFHNDTSDLGYRFFRPSFTPFHDRGWLTTRLADHLIDLLEVWSMGNGELARQLPEATHFNELLFFEKAIKQPATLTYFELVQFAAFVYYLTNHHGKVDKAALAEWMRVVTNLAANTDIERPEEFGRSLTGLQKLLPYSDGILQRLADMEVEPLGFRLQQIHEEKLKAQLILAASGWREALTTAEQHGYFGGQIDFLLDFAGVSARAEELEISTWDSSTHRELQDDFRRYLKVAQATFSASGLIPAGRPDQHLWKRALLTIGDYLLPLAGSNYSLLINAATNPGSWKRYLRGDGGITNRRYLKELWDRLDLVLPIERQLIQIIDSAPTMESWRTVLVGNPEAIDYCGLQEIRKTPFADQIYLMKKHLMNGYHAELFSYALHLTLRTDVVKIQLSPLTLDDYQAVSTSSVEPAVRLMFWRDLDLMYFDVVSVGGHFEIRTARSDLDGIVGLDACLKTQANFTEREGYLVQESSREEVQGRLIQLAQSLKPLRSQTSGAAL